MTDYTVRTPVPDHTGAVGGVTFVKGEATVSDERHAAELTYFRGAGYTVEEVNTDPAAPEVGDDDNDPTTPPPGNASAKAWLEHVLTLPGVTEDQVKDLNRDQLKELAAQLKEGQTQ